MLLISNEYRFFPASVHLKNTFHWYCSEKKCFRNKFLKDSMSVITSFTIVNHAFAFPFKLFSITRSVPVGCNFLCSQYACIFFKNFFGCSQVFIFLKVGGDISNVVVRDSLMLFLSFFILTKFFKSFISFSDFTDAMNVFVSNLLIKSFRLSI